MSQWFLKYMEPSLQFNMYNTLCLFSVIEKEMLHAIIVRTGDHMLSVPIFYTDVSCDGQLQFTALVLSSIILKIWFDIAVGKFASSAGQMRIQLSTCCIGFRSGDTWEREDQRLKIEQLFAK